MATAIRVGASPRDIEVMRLSRLSKRALGAELRAIWATKGIHQIYGAPPEKWNKDELINELLREEGIANAGN